ncbi:MAG: ATP-binding protein [Acidilobaceae archaeon]
MRLHPYIGAIVKNRSFTFIYGPPGSGKTRLGLEVARIAESLGYGVSVIATEAGTSLAYRSLGEAVSTALSIDDMVMKVVRGALRGEYVIVDTVNSYYRDSPSYESRGLLALASAMMRLSGGLALGQVSFDEQTAPGAAAVEKYALVTGMTRRLHEGKYLLEIVKPSRKLLVYEIRGEEVLWL